GVAGLNATRGGAGARQADALGIPAARVPRADRRGSPRPIAAVVATGIACAAVFQHRHALDYSFSQDDFLGLARATGLAPRLNGLWRLASHQWAWDALVATAGPNARAAHVVSIALWALLAALTTWLLTRRLGLVAGIVGGAFLAAPPAAFTAVGWISAHGE